MGPVGVVILAAGKGTRMRSRLPKVAHQVAGRAMLEHVLRAAADALTPSSPPDERSDTNTGGAHNRPVSRYVVVLGHESEQARAAIRWSPANDAASLTYVIQQEQLGTGDAVRAAHPAITAGSAPHPDTILVLYGDTPLVTGATIRALLDEHTRSGATLTFLTGIATHPTDYGRVLRDAAGRVRGVVEQKHATAEELAIPEVNSGIYVFAADWLWARLDRLAPHPNGEYYLTDLVEVAVREGRPISTVSAPLTETLGVNDRAQLAEVERILQARILGNLMLGGVTLQNPASTYVEAGVRVGQDTILLPGTMLRGATVIGEHCEIGPNSVIRDSQIGDDCRVLASWVEESVMEAGSRVGPMSHLRPGAHLAPGAHVGNFGEVKNALIGPNVQMHHFSYIGDATVGAETNIGAGSITMNYDGKDKHHTEIGERVFIGCDTLLRAPVTVGDDASTGGGAVVTRDVPPGKLVVGMPARVAPRVRSGVRNKSDEQAPEELHPEPSGPRERGADNGHVDDHANDSWSRQTGANASALARDDFPDHPPERTDQRGKERE